MRPATQERDDAFYPKRGRKKANAKVEMWYTEILRVRNSFVSPKKIRCGKVEIRDRMTMKKSLVGYRIFYSLRIAHRPYVLYFTNKQKYNKKYNAEEETHKEERKTMNFFLTKDKIMRILCILRNVSSLEKVHTTKTTVDNNEMVHQKTKHMC